MATSAMTMDLAPLWDFNDPARSEARFREALVGASPDDALILQTQIARTYGIRKDFQRARELLAAIEPRMGRASPEAKARYALELGRTYASATHPPETQNDETRAKARAAFNRAYDIAHANALDDLAIDALHMQAFVDTDPRDQLAWTRKALAEAQASSQPKAKAWEASLRNNVGVALHDMKRYDEALMEFREALVLRERMGKAENVRIARWMIAWTLRAQGKIDEALAMQLALERECEAAGAPDADVYEELEALYRAKHDNARAGEYARRRAAIAH